MARKGKKKATKIVVVQKQDGKRTVTAAPQKSKPKKKKAGWMSAIGTAAKGFASKGLDALAVAQPELAPLRALLKANTGFSERTLQPVGQAGSGQVVSTADAPVAFARGPMSTGIQRVAAGEKGIVRYLVRDLCLTLQTSGTLNTFNAALVYNINPVRSGLFPNFYTEFEDFVRWRPIRIKLHYVHFSGTSTKTAVCLAWVPDLNVAGSLGTRTASTTAVMGNSHAVQGSAYEDFALLAEPPEWEEGKWLYLFTAPDASEYYSQTDIMAGSIVVSTDINDTINNKIGYIYAELEFEVCEMAVPYLGAGLAKQMFRTFFKLKDDEEAEEFIAYALSKLVDTAKKDREKLKKTKALMHHGSLYDDFKSDTLKQQQDALVVPPPTSSLPKAGVRTGPYVRSSPDAAY